ncbi:MAG: metal-dependent hydrolase, partial [Pseudomonadota bacterium]
MSHQILDSHTHCGLTLTFQELSREWSRGGIDGGVVFAPVEEIYDRYDPFFFDSPEYARSRRSVHDYLLNISDNTRVFPYFFVWNDFARVPDGFVGIKWHRHSNEPMYAYDTPLCEELLNQICEKRMPVV